MENNLQLSIGTPVSCEKDIKSFMKNVSKEYNITLDNPDTIKEIIGIWKLDKKNNQHLVCFRNENYEWFINFLSNEDVKGTMNVEDTPPSELFIREGVVKP